MAITATKPEAGLTQTSAPSETDSVRVAQTDKPSRAQANPYQDRIDTMMSLFGILPDDITLEEARAERLSKI